jgi:hypothetical protein
MALGMSTSIQRGDRFRNIVADLLEASGIRAIAEVRDDFKKVDIIARTGDFVGEPITLLIEAKDYTGTLPKADCLEFLHEYGALAKRERGHQGWLVSRGPISPDGRALIESDANLRCFTFAELQRRLLQLHNYLHDVIASYERQQIEKFFIPPHTVSGEELAPLIEQWIADPDADPIAIMGGYGIGKTTFATHLAAALGQQALYDLDARVPILIPLGEVFDDQSVDGLIGKVLASKHRVGNYHFKLFEELNLRGRFVIIFDGFDEMKHGITVAQFERNVSEFMKLDQGEAKILLLGRDTAFHTDVEFRSVIQGRRQTGGGAFAAVRGRRPFKPIMLRGFTLEEARRYVKSFFPIKADEAARSNRTDIDQDWVRSRTEELINGSLDELLDRPVHAQMLCEIATQPEISLSGLSKYRLYDLFIHYLLEREVEKRGRYPGFDISTRRRFNTALAWWLWERGLASTTSFADIPDELCDAAVKDNAHEFDALGLRRELIAGCLVDKGGDAIFFSHRSIQEFLVSEHLIETDLLAKTSKEHEKTGSLRLVIDNLNPEIIDFILGRLRDSGIDQGLLERWTFRLVQLKGLGIPLAGVDLFAKALAHAELFPVAQAGPWEFWLYHFARLGRAEMDLPADALPWARRELTNALTASHDAKLAAILYWAHAIRLDRGNASELTGILVAHLMTPGRLNLALKDAKRMPNGVYIPKSADTLLWLLLSTADFSTDGRVTLDVGKLISLVEKDLGIGFDREVEASELRTVRQTSFCSPSDVIRAVVEDNRDQVPIRHFFAATDLRQRIRAKPLNPLQSTGGQITLRSGTLQDTESPGRKFGRLSLPQTRQPPKGKP